MARLKKLHTLPDGDGFSLEVERVGDGFEVRSEEPRFEAAVSSGATGSYSVLVDGASYEARVTHENGEIHVEVLGERFRFGVGSELDAGAASSRATGRKEVKAPMPGKVVKLLAAAGDALSAGQGVLLFEAMKMQNEIRSPQDGVLADLAVEEGQAIEARELLFVVQSK